MDFSHSHSHITVTRHVNVIDGPTLPNPGRDGEGTQFRLRSLTVGYTLANDGKWRHDWVAARGPVLKADGTDSREEFDGRVHALIWKRDPDWAFLHAAIDGMRPTGSVTLPFRPPFT